MSALTEALTANADALVARTHAAMYANPFWEERFGERGRRFVREDGRHHITYLIAALDADSMTVLTAYATWLRGVLVPRGMCSLHLAQHFTSLADGIRTEKIPGAEAACAYLQAAIEALDYTDGAAGKVQRSASRLARAALDRLVDAHPEWPARLGADGLQRCLDDFNYHLSYLADSLAIERPELFVAYLQWIAGFLERRGVPGREFDTALETLSYVIEVQLPVSEATVACELLAAGRLAVLAGASRSS